MDTIVTLALVGTGQQHTQEIVTGTPIDTLAAQLSPDEREHALLLTAGAWAIYRLAGRTGQTPPAVPEPAILDTLPPCSPATMLLIESILQSNRYDLLPETFTLLAQAGLRLPYEEIPQLLSLAARSKKIRHTLMPVIGERGRWLSRFNLAWSWTAQFLAGAENAIPANAETIWQEGTLGQRQELLRRLRAVEPAKARTWLAATWKQEKADARAKLLASLEIGLSPEDEPLLEKMLDERITGIRSTVGTLLARIPTSAFTQRMQARARTMLDYQKDTLTVVLPESFDNAWRRDGIIAGPQQNVVDPTHWLIQILALVSPSYWEEQFTTTPKQLIAAATSAACWKAILEGWSQATIMHHNTAWAGPLWSWWFEIKEENEEMQSSLLALTPQEEITNRMKQLFDRPPSTWSRIPREVPEPWSKAFGEVYLAALRKSLEEVQHASLPYTNWIAALDRAAISIPPSCFDAALAPWEIPDSNHWRIRQCSNALETFTDTLQLRKRIIEEIAQ